MRNLTILRRIEKKRMIGEKIEISQREMEVIACMVIGGKSYKETGRLLGISPKTVETHLRRVTDKYRCTKSDLRRAIGQEKLTEVYNHIENSVTHYNKHRNAIFFSVCTVVVTVIVLIWGYFKKDIVFNSNVRLDNNLHLIPRESVACEMTSILSRQSQIKTVVISGVGGAGKTTLARSFIKKQKAVIKWEIDATTEQEVEISFRRLAHRLAKLTAQETLLRTIETISDANSRREEIIAFVATVLKSIPNWILFFDNVQDSKIAKKYIPSNINTWGSGSIIVTTRNSRIVESSPFSADLCIKIPEFTLQEQFELFTSINRGSLIDKKELEEFLRNIPRLPLDTAITAYYIKNTGIRLNDYLKYLQEYSDDFQKIQYKITASSINYSQTRFEIISSDSREIIKDNPEFKDLLLFIAAINNRGIKINDLKRLKPDIVVDSFLYELQKYSLIEVVQGSCNMHKFIHKVSFHYILTQFSEEEIKAALDKIVNVFAIGYSEVQKLSLDERLNLSQHIESLIRKIDRLKINSKRRYKILLSNTLLHCYMNLKSRDAVKRFAQKIIKESNNILPDRELIKLLEICGNYNLISQNYDEAGKYLFECMAICGKKTEFQHMKAVCLLDLAVLSEMKGDLQEAQQRRKQAFEFVNFSKDLWSMGTKLDLFSRFYRYYKKLFVCSREFQQVIDLGHDILKDLNADRFFYKENMYLGREHEQIFSIRRYMIALYNKIGDFEEALENVKECEFFFDLIKKAGIPFINKEATFRMREGYTLLRLNKLDAAESVLKRCIQVHKELGETPCIAQALLYLTEVLMRQNKWDEAYECARQSLKRMDKASSNNDRFFKVTCYYFLAIMELRQKEYSKALEYFNEFLNLSNAVCRSMLDSKIYGNMARSGVFSNVKHMDDLQKGFDSHAVRIFKEVYDPLHPFITDFVCKYGKFFAAFTPV